VFSNKDLRILIVPLIIEQILAVAVGMADTVMVSSVGEAAISGVSLVDTFAILLIGLFAALATGGSVVAAQYLGGENREKANRASKQLLLLVTVLSTFLAIISLVANKGILQLIYGDISSDVMENARLYFYITALSYPFLAIYNGCAALFRAMGNSQVSMRTSIVMNGINIIGNAICLYGFKMGVEGVAIPTLISRVVAAVITMVLIKNRQNPIFIDRFLKIKFDISMIKRIAGIGIPNGIENSVFQIGKILVQGVVASFGTAAISANAVASNISRISTIPGGAIGLATITIVGRCIGAREFDEAKKNIRKLMILTYIITFFLNVAIVVFINPTLSIFKLSPQTYELAKQLSILHSAFAILIWPSSFTLPNALRAANDARFTMGVSMLSMWLFRIILSYVFAIYFNMGLIGVWIAMIADWLFRSICFISRILTGKWLKYAYKSA
jgi:putative MATE family efflux protein